MKMETGQTQPGVRMSDSPPGPNDVLTSVNLQKPAIVNFSAKAWRHGAALRAPRVSVPAPHRFTPGREPPNVGSDLFAPGGSLPYGLPVGAGGCSHG